MTNPTAPPEAATSRRRGERGLDWFSFFCANLQTGFGPFVAVYLTTSKWTQTDIGLVLMIGGLVGLFGQIPGGALVDRARSKIVIAAVAVAAIGVSALCVALSAFFPIILFAWVLHAAASCLLSPSIATISLGLVGYARIGSRLGRNATFASVGSAIAAAGMGAFGYYISNQAVFFVTAALAVPAIAALTLLRREAADTPRAETPKTKTPKAKAWHAKAWPGQGVVQAQGPSQPARPPAPHAKAPIDWKPFLTNRPLIVLAVATALFYLANAAMLPLVGSVLTMRSAHSPTILIAACIIVPQAMVALLSPLVGAKGESWGRRPLLILGFAALPIRGLCLGLVQDPTLFVAVQVLDGISASVLGVIIPLVAADATRHLGRFALAQGIIGTAMGLGASFSSTIAGYMTDHYGSRDAFFGLTALAMVALLITILFMPETRERDGQSPIAEPARRGPEPARARPGSVPKQKLWHRLRPNEET